MVLKQLRECPRPIGLRIIPELVLIPSLNSRPMIGEIFQKVAGTIGGGEALNIASVVFRK